MIRVIVRDGGFVLTCQPALRTRLKLWAVGPLSGCVARNSAMRVTS
jgi:hypothetical protein